MHSEKLANCLGSCFCCPVSFSPCVSATKVPTHSSLVGAGLAAKAGIAMATIIAATTRATVANINARFILTSPFAVVGGGQVDPPPLLSGTRAPYQARKERHIPHIAYLCCCLRAASCCELLRTPSSRSSQKMSSFHQVGRIT